MSSHGRDITPDEKGSNDHLAGLRGQEWRPSPWVRGSARGVPPLGGQQMRSRKRWITILVCCATPILGLGVAAAATWLELQYQDRGDRYEGIKSRPVGGQGLELVSALADTQDDSSSLPSYLAIGFFLPQNEDVHITVRELRYRTYYWLDRVRPEKPWQAGSINVFSWPTATVIEHLEHLTPDDLGVVVTLGKDTTSLAQSVTPSMLFSSGSSPVARGYLFTLRTRTRARVACRIYRTRGTEVLAHQSYDPVLGDMPFTFRWDARQTDGGWYELHVSGYQISDNQPIKKVVRFYHHKALGS